MAITRAQKETTLKQLTEDLRSARGVVFTQYKGLSVAAVTRLRKLLRAQNVKFQVIKLTLLKKALAALNISGEPGTSFAVPGKPKFGGPIAVAVSQEEEAAPARLLKSLMKDNPQLVFDGGILNSQIVGSDVILKLASLPSKQQLLSQLLSVLQGPSRGLVTVLSGNMRGLVNALKAIKDKKF